MVSDSSFGQLPISVLMMYRILGLVLLLSVVTGCENLIEIELPDSSPEIVVIAPFTTDIPWQVSLQRTVGIHDTTPKPAVIENATVKIQGDDGSEVELSYWGGGFYTSPATFPKVGVTYTLTVEADGYKRVEARDRIPDPPTVRDVRVFNSEIDRRFEIEIDDDGNVENYYELAIIYPYLRSEAFIVTSSELEEQMRSFAIQDPLSPDVTRPELNSALIQDTPFNGEIYVISLTEVQPNDDVPEQSVYIRAVSRAYYEYYRSQIIQKNTDNLPFSESANILSNIQNGQGIFAGYHLYVHGETTYQSIMDRIPGTYTATKYNYYDNDDNSPYSLDYLNRGASIQLTLKPDYSTTGQMHLPPLDSDSPTDDVKVVSLDGGYSIQAYDFFNGHYILTLYHSSDTILRDIQFRIGQDAPNFQYLILDSELSQAFSWAQQSDARFNGGGITLSRVEE